MLNLVALKLVYFIVERGYSFMTYPGLIPKLELKSPTTVVLLDLSYFYALWLTYSSACLIGILEIVLWDFPCEEAYCVTSLFIKC